MIVGPDKFEELWERGVKADLAESEDKKLLIFVSSTEADSVCAVHILQVRISTPIPLKQIILMVIEASNDDVRFSLSARNT